MSTKTAFKRVALVAAAALAIGGLTSVSANAVAGDLLATLDSTGVISSASATGIAGANNFVQVNQAAVAGTAYHVVATGGILNVVTGSATGTGTASAVTGVNGAVLFNVPTTAVGTITIKNYPIVSGVESGTAQSTVTITVLAAPAGTVYNHATAFAGAVGADVVADVAQSAPQAASNTAAAQITISQYSSSDASQRILDGSSTAVVATISGAGQIGLNSGSKAAVVAIAAGTANSSTVPNQGVQNLYVYPNGVAGVGTVTISVNGAVVATKTVTFTGAFTSYTSASTIKAALGVADTQTIVVTGLDSNSNVAAIPTTFWTTSDATIATVTPGVNGTVDVTGVVSGTATITAGNAASSPTVTKAFTIVVTKATAKTVTIATDKANYAPGEKITLTVTAKDANGAAVGDGAKNLFGATGITANVNLVGTLPATSVTLAGGVATYTLYAPLQGGTVSLSGVEGSATDNVIANGATAAAAITGSFTVTADTTAVDAANSAADIAAEALDAANAATDAATAAADAADAATSAAQDAVDAANAATDAANAAADAASNAETAANAATDAANAAADAADSATSAAQDAADAANAATDAANKAADQAGQALAAVNALAVSVAKLITSVKAQITSLTNLVVKIQKKVKA